MSGGEVMLDAYSRGKKLVQKQMEWDYCWLDHEIATGHASNYMLTLEKTNRSILLHQDYYIN